ncbi:MAG TPA: CinA family protein [Desulfonatronum sp.]|mgnify:CR=1 FL=1|nr:CinA family protein [Desulfonatronum sp.]
MSLQRLRHALGRELAGSGLRLAVAESCSGGLIAHWLTNVPGSSHWFSGGVVAYANAVKVRCLGVPETAIASHGAVSREVVLAMALGVRDLLATDSALAVSGIAGPGGGSPEKPVGTVWMAWVLQDAIRSKGFQFRGTRLQIKKLTAMRAMAGMLEMLRRQR